MKKTLERRLLTRVLLVAETAALIGLLLWLHRESQVNDFMRGWLSSNFPSGLILLGDWAVTSTITGIIILTAYLTDFPQSTLALYRRLWLHAERRIELENTIPPRTTTRVVDQTKALPFYETVDLPYLVIGTALLTQATSLWFITAADFHISSFPSSSYYYLANLPVVYWWGLAATLGTIMLPTVLRGRARTPIELSGLFLLALYLIGLPSFSYQDPRFLDAYYHTGNSLDLLNSMGWFRSPNWYVHQFPGAFSYFAQLSTVAGIDPFQLIKYFPAGLSLVVVFFAYVVARMFSPNYAAAASGLILGGFWFQLHVSPQAFELPLYFGFLFLILKAIEDVPRRKLWTAISIVTVPVFVGSHPETPLAVGLGLFAFVFLSFFGGLRPREIIAKIAPVTIVLATVAVSWWFFIAVDARELVQSSILNRAIQSLSQLSPGIAPQSVPTTPAPSYAATLLLEEVTAVVIWGSGLILLPFIRRFQARERLLYGFFLAAVATIPIAVFAKADVLQRSYLFALLPFGLLVPWLLERRAALNVGGKSLYPFLKGGLIVSLLLFAALIPVARYGVDPFQYIPSSALTVDSIAAGISSHSILFLHPEEDGWRFYAGLNGATSQPKLEQGNILFKSGGYFKPNSDPTVPPFNLTYSNSDGTADYIVLSNYYDNVYVLRFGPTAETYLAARHSFEGNVTLNFDLVYSTGLDRLYANRNVP